jgi:hypothetical protein
MSYATIEQSENLSEQTYLYLISLPDRTLSYTNAPLAVVATIDVTDYVFVHPRGGIWHGSSGSDLDKDPGPTESPDAGRTGIDIRVSHLNPIVRAHRSFPPPGNTDVAVYRQNEIDGDPYLVWSGVIVETPIQGSTGILRCQHIIELVAGSEGLSETHGPTCPYMTYSFPCPVSANDFRQAITITDIDLDNFTITVSGIVQPDAWFTAGIFEAANGDKRFILDHSGTVLTLQQNFPATTLKIGDDASILAGDDHLFSTCQFKFGAQTGNGAAFGGNNLQANKNPHQVGRIQ